MKGLANKIIYVFVILGIFSSVVMGCSYRISPYKEFNTNEYIFTGKVVGYTDAVEFNSRKADPRFKDRDWFALQGHGVIVEVVELVHSPMTNEKTYEVFNYGSRGDCLETGKGYDELKREYPLNAEVIVIAERATLVGDLSENHVPRLEIKPVTGSFRVSFSDKKKEFENATDFSKYFDNDINTPWFASLLKYEIRKDLLRLKRAINQEERKQPLDRLLTIPHNRLIIDFYKILLDNLPTQKEAESQFTEKLRSEGWKEKRIRTIIKCNQDMYGLNPRRKNTIIC